VRKIAAILLIIMTLAALSMSSINTAHAATMTGTYTLQWTWTGHTTLANGTVVDYAKDATTYLGAFSGTSNGAEKDYEHPDGSGTFAIVENFTGSFNASKSGAITFRDVGYYKGYGLPNYWEASFSGGTGGLAGLQGVLAAKTPGGACSGAGTFCTFQGTYTVTSATWETPVPEFPNTTQLITVGLFAISIGLIILKRKHAGQAPDL